MTGPICACLACGKPMICPPYSHNICCGAHSMGNPLAHTLPALPCPISAAITAALNAAAGAVPSRELSLAKTKLQEALFWASQAESPEREP